MKMDLKLKTLMWIMCLVLLCCIHVTQGSCLSYGHSCWGAHGKRNGVQQTKTLQRNVDKVPRNNWELIKILQGKDDWAYGNKKKYGKPLNFFPISDPRQTDDGYIRFRPQVMPQIVLDDSKQQDLDETLAGKSYDPSLAQEGDSVVYNDDPLQNSIFDENINRGGHNLNIFKTTET